MLILLLRMSKVLKAVFQFHGGNSDNILEWTLSRNYQITLLKSFLTKALVTISRVALHKICNEVDPGAEGNHGIQASLRF